MSALEELNILSYVKRHIQNGSTHKTITEDLRSLFPGVHGISVRSLKRYCAAHDVHSTSRLSDRVLDILVSFGRGMVSNSIIGQQQYS